MTADYRLGAGGSVQRTSDGAWIPDDLQNTDWQDYQVWLAVPNTPDPAPGPSPDDMLNAKLGAGVQIVSTGTSALSATYATDFSTQQNIIGIVTSIAAGEGLPLNASTIPWPDIQGSPHSFSADQFKAFATAVRDYVFGLRQTWGAIMAGQTDAPWPAQPVTIA